MRLKVPSTGNTPRKHKLVSQVEKFKAFADLNEDLIRRSRHVRFYTTLLLKDLLNDAPLEAVSNYYGLSLGEIQSF